MSIEGFLIGAIVLAALWYLYHTKIRNAADAATKAIVSSPLTPTPVANAVNSLDGFLDKLDDNTIGMAFVKRSEEKAADARRQAALENIARLTMAQMSNVPSAMPSEVNPHPAAALAPTPAPAGVTVTPNVPK